MKETAIFPPLSERELKGAAVSLRAAREGMVLLYNRDRALPLTPGRVCLYGNGAVRTVRGGTGSGDPFNGGLTGGGDVNVDLSPRYHIQLLPAMQRAGFTVLNEAELLDLGRRYDAEQSKMTERVMSTFRMPDDPVEEASAAEYAKTAGTALYVITRNSGEGNDRNVSALEKSNIALLRRLFKKLIVLLNVGGPVSAADLKNLDADAILLMGQGGQECGEAAAQVLTGRENPSGKLTATWAERYEDYPSASTYLSDRDVSLYNEGSAKRLPRAGKTSGTSPPSGWRRDTPSASASPTLPSPWSPSPRRSGRMCYVPA